GRRATRSGEREPVSAAKGRCTITPEHGVAAVDVGLNAAGGHAHIYGPRRVRGRDNVDLRVGDDREVGGFDGAEGYVEVARSAREVAAGDRDRGTAASRPGGDVEAGHGGRQVHDLKVGGVNRLEDVEVVVIPLRGRHAGRVHVAAIVGDNQTVI